jgi:polysaccharide export outer membrane protein
MKRPPLPRVFGRVFEMAVLVISATLMTGAFASAQAVQPDPQTGPPAATQAAAPGTAPQLPADLGPQVGSNYKLRPGDEVTLTVYGEASLSPTQPLRVLPGGAIEVPLVGEVVVGGRTPAEAGDMIARKLQRYLKQPRVTLAVFNVAPVESLILGNVKTPGKYTLLPPARLTDVIAAAGGLGPTDGDLPEARIQTAAGTITTVSLQKLLHDGDLTQNVAIQPGDEVYVPSPNLFAVHVIGAVDKPGDVLLHEGDDLAMAVARAGTSTNSNPDLNRITVTRTDSAGKSTITNINLYDVLKNGDKSQDIKMVKGDLVYVPQARKQTGAGTAGDIFGILRSLIFL